MTPNLKYKAIFILVVILGCIYSLVGLPTFPTSIAQLKDNFGHQIKLGLDLQGGTHLILQVQVQEAIAQETDQTVDRLTAQLRAKNIPYDEVRRLDDTHILVRNIDPAQVSAFRDLISAQYGNLWDLGPTAGDPNGFTLTLRTGAIAQIQETTMALSVETIDRRINALGLTEPTVQTHGRKDNEILVQLPGEGDPTRAKEVIQEAGQLELKLVEDPDCLQLASRCAAKARRRATCWNGVSSRRCRKSRRSRNHPMLAKAGICSAALPSSPGVTCALPRKIAAPAIRACIR